MGNIFHSCNAKWKAHCCIMTAILTYLFWGHSCVPQARAQSTENIAPPTEQTERVKTVVHLYFLNSSKNFLTAEERVIARSPDPQEFSAQIVAELINGPQKELIATVPQQARLRALFVAENGIGYVDLSQTIREHHPGGNFTELMTIYSIVNSLVLNVAQIKAVKILIEGQEALTLAGHIDLRFPFKANMLLIR